MTDQEALERAADFLWPRYYASDENNTTTRAELIANDGSCAALAWLLDAIASEARAAERKTVLEIIADVRRRYAPATAASAALDYAAHRIECALATPAQSAPE